MTDVPAPVARVSQVMAHFGAPWALCGGWAVDAWLGRQTRDHGDVDISVFEGDVEALYRHLSPGWQLIAHDAEVRGDSKEPWDGRPLTRPAHIHAGRANSEGSEALQAWVQGATAAPPTGDDFKLEILVDRREGEAWVFADKPPLRLPVASCRAECRWGVPALTPAVLMFFKATAYFGDETLWDRPQDCDDFLALRETLRPDEGEWLRGALSRLHAAHPWLESLPARRTRRRARREAPPPQGGG